MISLTVSMCSNCGGAIDETDQVEDMDATHCSRCNRRFYAGLAAAYPFGQCNDCGAEGYVYGPGQRYCVYGWERGPHHAEGGCGRWADGGERDDHFPRHLTPVRLRLGPGGMRLRQAALVRHIG